MESNHQMANSQETPHHEVMQAEVGFDKQEPHSLLIAGFGIATIIGLVVLVFGLRAYFNYVSDQQVNDQVLVPLADDFKQLRIAEDEALRNYKYIDRDKGIVQIPVERAMELVANEAAAGKVQYFSKEYPVKTPNADQAGAAAGQTAGAGVVQANGAGNGTNGSNSGAAPAAKQ